MASTPQFRNGHRAQDHESDGERGQTQPAKEMHRPREVFQQELDGQDVEHHVERPAQAVVRIARDARRIADRNFGDARAVETGQRGNEAMQLAVEINVLEHFGAVSLERGSEIAQRDSRRFRHQPVGDARGKFAGDSVVDAFLAPAARDVVAFLDLGEQRRNILRRVLQIAIERNDHVALRLIETGGKSGGLSEIAAQANDFQTAVGFDQIGQQVEAAIRGRVIHRNDFVRLLNRFQYRRQPVVKRQDGRFLIVDRDDDRQHGRKIPS